MEKLYKVIRNPNNPKILAIAKNYVKHVKEMGGDQPPKEPVIFQKPHSSIFMALQKMPTIYPLPRHGREIHHEIELGFIIRKQVKFAKQEDWEEIIGGYFLALDMTDRSLQAHFKKEGLPWDLAKGQDNFLPLSDLVFANQVIDPHNLDLELKINGKVVQADSTGSMYYKIPFLIQYLSEHMTLNVGDLVLTGTPHGIGPIRSGDELRAQLIQDDVQLAKIELDIE